MIFQFKIFYYFSFIFLVCSYNFKKLHFYNRLITDFCQVIILWNFIIVLSFKNTIPKVKYILSSSLGQIYILIYSFTCIKKLYDFSRGSFNKLHKTRHKILENKEINLFSPLKKNMVNPFCSFKSCKLGSGSTDPVHLKVASLDFIP